MWSWSGLPATCWAVGGGNPFRFFPFRPLNCLLLGGGVASRAWPEGLRSTLDAGVPAPSTLALGGGKGKGWWYTGLDGRPALRTFPYPYSRMEHGVN